MMGGKGLTELGGFQAAAELLTDLSGRNYSRQGVQQLYKRRAVNHFPALAAYQINGKMHMYFNLRRVKSWYDARGRHDWHRV